MPGFLRNLFFDGFHPVFPGWRSISSACGSPALTCAATPGDAPWQSVAVVVVTETAAWIVVGPKGTSLDQLADDSWRWLFSVSPSRRCRSTSRREAALRSWSSWARSGSGEHLPERVAEPLISTGQLALTIYLAHVFVGMGILEATGRLEDQSLAWAVGTGLVFSMFAILGSWAWRRRFARGPVEWLMRRVAGRTGSRLAAVTAVITAIITVAVLG